MILIIGDIFIDKYLFGSSKRLSPEFSVPVINFDSETTNLGGAGNVLMNIKNLNVKNAILARIGDDLDGNKIKKKIKESELIVDKKYQTIVKTRVISNNNHICRLDYESFDKSQYDNLKYFSKIVKKYNKKVKVLILSDYGKGFINKSTLKIIFKNFRNTKIIVDPDASKSFLDYSNVDFITPNIKETSKMIGYEIENTNKHITKVLKEIKKKSSIKNIVITRGEKGCSLINERMKVYHFPSKEVSQIFDVSGAGDTFISVLSGAIYKKINIFDSIKLANNCSSYVVKKKNTVPILRSEFNYELNLLSKINY